MRVRGQFVRLRKVFRGMRAQVRYKEGGIPSIAEEYEALREQEGNKRERTWRDAESCCDWRFYVEG